MKREQIESRNAYTGPARQVRFVVKFSANGARVLYRQLDRGTAKGAQLLPVGGERWVALDTFAGWAMAEVS